jgi:hypothetical protein
MAQDSLFWIDSTGDGGPYTQDDLATWLKATITGDQEDGEGVLATVEDELAVSGVATPLSVAAGAAYVHGHFYVNTAAVAVTVAAPSVSTRIDRIVLQADWTAQTIRIAKIDGVEGGAAPALTQTDGTKWEISLAQISTTTGGVITVTDEREFCHFATRIGAANLDAAVAGDGLAGGAGTALSVNVDDSTIEIDSDTLRVKDGGIVEAKIGAGAVVEAKIGALAVTEGKIGAGAVTEAKLGALAVTSDKIANLTIGAGKIAALQITEGKIADEAITHAKLADDAVEVNNLADDIDATGIGFDADKVDGYDAADLIGGGVPIGSIIMWSGTLGGTDGHRPVVSGTADEKWHICNGDLVGAVQTPDMEGMFPLHVGGTFAAALGATGGRSEWNWSHAHAGGTLQVPSLAHYPNLFAAIGAGGTWGYLDHPATDITGSTANNGSASESLMPPYYALYFIMKVA